MLHHQKRGFEIPDSTNLHHPYIGQYSPPLHQDLISYLTTTSPPHGHEKSLVGVLSCNVVTIDLLLQRHVSLPNSELDSPSSFRNNVRTQDTRILNVGHWPSRYRSWHVFVLSSSSFFHFPHNWSM